jgi:hypothetical protein
MTPRGRRPSGRQTVLGHAQGQDQSVTGPALLANAAKLCRKPGDKLGAEATVLTYCYYIIVLLVPRPNGAIRRRY